MMRKHVLYQVSYDGLVAMWAVVDTKAANHQMAFHETEDEARKAAWYEEERWYKCTPVDEERPSAG
jgi:hypothetical protein|tara:strand:- start:226 stop:423 length:198 start_codon:yes stop_codon:yes gene_type:complete